MRLSTLALLAGLAFLAGCIGAVEDPAEGSEGPVEIESQTRDPPATAAPKHPDPEGNGTLDNASEGGFSMTHVPPGDYATNLSGPSQVLEEGPYEVAEERVVELESPVDGADIQVGVVLPDVPNGTRVPVIGLATIYLYHHDLQDVDLSEHPRLAPYVDNYVPHGYAVAAIPVRGTADSGGCNSFGGPAERADLDRAVTWLGEQPWSNGNVSLGGLSYDGYAAWEAASTGNPHLKTIFPIGGINDLYHHFYPNGTTRVQGAGELQALTWVIGVDNRRGPSKALEAALCPGFVQGVGSSIYASASGERDPTGYWAGRNFRPGVEANYTGSVLLVHGLQDWNVRPGNNHPWIWDLQEQTDVVVKQLLGQWGHLMPDYTPAFDVVNPHARWDWAQTLLHWFDYWLKGDTTRDLGPPVQVQDDTGQWRSSWTWPPADAEQQTRYLTPEGSLARQPAEAEDLHPVGPDPGRTVTHVDDLQDLCATCPTFTTEAFEEDTRLAGRPRAHLTVTPTSPGGSHLTAYLFASGDDGAERLGWGIIDLRHADGDDQAQPVVPGQPVEVRLSLEPMDAVVPAGDELVLLVSQGTYDVPFPRYETSPERVDTSAVPPHGLLLHSGGEQSTLSFQAFQPDSERFFEPPGS